MEKRMLSKKPESITPLSSLSSTDTPSLKTPTILCVSDSKPVSPLKHPKEKIGNPPSNTKTLLSRMPYHLELGSDGKSFHGKAIVVNTMTGRHHSNAPIPMKKAKAQMRLLEQIEKKK